MDSTTREIVATLAVVVMFAVIAFIVGWMAGSEYERPYCPTEDSCLIDYSNGEWHIYPVSD